jgi:hypothetical protein
MISSSTFIPSSFSIVCKQVPIIIMSQSRGFLRVKLTASCALVVGTT